MKAIWALITFPIRIIVLFLTAGKRNTNKVEIQKIKGVAIEFLDEKYDSIKEATKKASDVKEVSDLLEYLKTEESEFRAIKASVSFIDSMANFSLEKTLESTQKRWDEVKDKVEKAIETLKEKATIYKFIQTNIDKINKIKEKIDTKIQIEERRANFKDELGIFIDQLNDLTTELKEFDFSQDEAVAKKLSRDLVSKANKISIDYDQKLRMLEDVLKKIDKFISWVSKTNEQVNKLIENNYFAAEKMNEDLIKTRVDLEQLRYAFDFVEANSLYEKLRSEYDSFIKDAPKV